MTVAPFTPSATTALTLSMAVTDYLMVGVRRVDFLIPIDNLSRFSFT